GMQTRDEDFVAKLFSASNHTPILYFSSLGRVYKEKVWRLPEAAPQARGKALINILPLEQGERITSIMPLPEDEGSWGDYDVMFATTSGTVRRNKLSDFVDVRRSGIIAMKLAEGEAIVDVQICTERDDVLLTASGGQCIRFPVAEVRVFQGRTSMGVRGIALAEGDRVISLAILHHFEATPAERASYLKQSGAIRRAATGEDIEPEEATPEAEEAAHTDLALSQERYAEMGAAEQFVLTVTAQGYGKRSSSFEFRVSGRGGKGIRASDPTKLGEIGPLVAAFPVEMSDQIMLVSDGGQLIRVPVEGIRITSRASKGVRVFNTADEEKVVSVERIGDDGEGENGNGEGNGEG
ncbi:MAG: DNA gyrase C-terminal beta-propeller domain-containing protein, partial [Xanthobacteraceae bacterium]